MTAIQDTIFPSLHAALKKHQTPALAVTSAGNLALQPLGLFGRIAHLGDAKYHEMRLSEVARLAAKALAIQQRLSFAEASDDRDLAACRKFLKHCKEWNCNTPEVAELKKEITAAKLGIHRSVLDKNPGFGNFAEAHHLERYLLVYGHELRVDPLSQKIYLLKEGEYYPWDELCEEIKQWPKPSGKFTQQWVYGEDGIHNKDMYDWTELKPYKKGNPADWHHQYVFEFCSCYNPATPFAGNHSWIRLKTPEGDIYSVGIYTTEKINSINSKGLRVKSGHLMAPDVSEFWNFEIGTIEVAITKEQFLEMKKTIEDDKKRDDLVFQLTVDNCVIYNKKIASIAGVDLPTQEHALKFLLSERAFRRIEALPAGLKKVCDSITTVFVNSVQLHLGAHLVDKNLNPKQREKAMAPFTKIADLFNKNKAYVHHPSTFAFGTRAWAAKWRNGEIDKVKAGGDTPRTQEAKIRKINFSLPAHVSASAR